MYSMFKRHTKICQLLGQVVGFVWIVQNADLVAKRELPIPKAQMLFSESADDVIQCCLRRVNSDRGVENAANWAIRLRGRLNIGIQ